jgi:ABC-type bacteriocin/lantibiotic exporter with double-glycine peptidase domain
MKINTVIQQEVSGCGLACVAMLVGKPYGEVKNKANRLGIFSEDKKLWSETGYVRQLLKKYEIKASRTEKPFSTWAELPELALLAIKYHHEKGRPFWHWVIFERSENESIVHDPATYLKANKRKDFDLIEPKWFIEIIET